MLQSAVLRRVEHAKSLLGKAPEEAQTSHEYGIAKSYIDKIQQAMPPKTDESADQVIYWLTRVYSLITILIERNKSNAGE